jgi:beta-mannosidase
MVKITFLSIITTVFFLFQSNAQQFLEWKILHPKTKKWLELGTKGSVQEALIASGELPDPFVGLNESKFTWIEAENWEFQSTFTLSQADLLRTIDLDFPSIDTYASIYLNGQLIAQTDNAFVHFRFAINQQAKVGVNQLKIIFESPVTYQKKHLKEVGVTLPSPNDVGSVKVAPYCRKPQYQFGWDWALRMNTIGFWEPATVVIYDKNRLIGKTSVTRSLTEDKAVQEFTAFLRNDFGERLFWESKLFGTKEVIVSNGKIVREETVPEPKLWWPRGQGEQSLYTDEWLIRSESGVVLFKGEHRFGIRTSELIQEKDQWGTSFLVKVNGRPIFCKGADYIPDDVFPARITDEKLRSAVETMAECHFNMVRIWGGGFYPREVFLDACDEMGIMVWEDFMFACSMYPGNDAFVENIQREFNQQIPRIAAHPSVVVFNGNNEVDVAWKNWGFQQTYKLTEKDQKTIERYYHRVFKEVLPTSVAAFTNVPYVHTSPLSNWGKEEFYNHGTQHYWGVWHGKDPIEDFGRKSGRFNAEYGFQSFPEFSTLNSFSQPEDWKLDSPVMKHHQKSYVGNGMIAKHSDILFGKTTDFERFVYYSQLTQAKAVSMAVVSHRVQYPRVTGTIYWQYNDCWQAPTWSSVDYFGNWKALQYVVKEDYSDLTIAAKVDTLGKEKYFLISDLPNGFGVHSHLDVYDFSGKQLAEFNCQKTVLGPSATELFVEELKAYKGKNTVYVFTWYTEAGTTFSRTFVNESVKRVTASSVLIDVKVDYNPQTNKGEVVIETDQLLIDFWLTCLKLGVHFDRNFESLLPGKHVISFTSEQAIGKEDLKWFFR